MMNCMCRCVGRVLQQEEHDGEVAAERSIHERGAVVPTVLGMMILAPAFMGVV